MIKKYIIAIIVWVITVAFATYAFYFKDINEMVTENNPTEAGKHGPIIAQKTDDATAIPMIKVKPLLLNEDKQVLNNEPTLVVYKLENKIPDQMLSESNSTSDNYVAKLIQILDDISNDKDSREDSAKALIKSGDKEGVLSVLKAIINAHVQEDYVIKENLMQIFADVDSVEAADMLADVLTGKSPFSSDMPGMPEDIAYAIKNAIGLMPNEVVGEMLAQKYYEASEEEKIKLMDIKHPVMIARIASDAYGQGDNETANRYMVELAGIENNLAIKGMMVLVREQSISLDNITNMLSSCSFMNSQNDQTHFMFVEYLGNAEFSPEERSFAAYAMASENDKEMAIAALKKAQLFEEDPLVKQYIEEALSRIDDTSQNT